MAYPASSSANDSHADSLATRKLDRLLHVLTGIALAGATFELVASFVRPEEHTRTGALIGIVVCAGMFVRWSSLPFLSKRLERPGTYLGILTKLVLGVTLAFAPYLVAHGRYAAATSSLIFAVASFGLWMRWRWVAWVWYVLLLVSFWAMARSFWAVAAGTSLLGLDIDGLWLPFHAIPRLFSLVVWLVFVSELVQWQRELRAEARAQQVTASATAETPAASSVADDEPSASPDGPTPTNPS